MEFRYDFSSKPYTLDLTRFKKQGPTHIATIHKLRFLFLLNDFKVVVEIETPPGNPVKHLVIVYFCEITRDKDFDIITEKTIIPLIDTRFKEIISIQKLFVNNHYKAYFESDNATETVNKLCVLLRIVYKINSLKAFI